MLSWFMLFGAEWSECRLTVFYPRGLDKRSENCLECSGGGGMGAGGRRWNGLLVIALGEEVQQLAAEGEGPGCEGEVDRSPV